MTKTTKPMPDKKEKLTAKEVEHDIYWDIVLSDGKNPSDYLTKVERIELIKEYARQKCKEQREICAKNAKACIDNSAGRYKERPFVYTKTILNASKPKFD